MFDLCKVELLKSKRTFQRRFLLIGPILFGGLLMLAANAAPDAMQNAWEHYTKMIFNIWTMTFNTLGISMLCILSEQREQRICSYRLFFVESKSLSKMWVSKVLVLSLYCFIATFLVTLFVSLLAGFHHLDVDSIIDILKMGGLSWLASLSVIPLVLYLTYHFGVLVTFAVGVIGLISAPIMASGKNWVFNPYSYSLRAIIPITEIQPNAVKVSGESELLNTSLISVAIVLTIILMVLFSGLTSILFKKREVG